MCGIAGIHLYENDRTVSRPQLETFVNALLLGIESRGRHATGIATMRFDGKVTLRKKDVEASKFVKERGRLPRQAQTILCHTRWATQGSPARMGNNHPIRYNDAFITHNGHISNDSELFESEGMKRKAEVDSEVIAALFDKYGIDKAHLPLQKLQGGFAVAAMDTRKPGTLVLAKGWNSPLITLETKHGIVWASTEWAIKEAFGKTFGWRPESSVLKEWKEPGTILLVEGGKVEQLKFKPASKPAPKVTATDKTDDIVDGWERRGTHLVKTYGDRTPRTPLTRAGGTAWQDGRRERCLCSCEKFWHANGECDGHCLNRNCDCRSFRPAATAKVGATVTTGPKAETDDAPYSIKVGDKHIVFRPCAGCKTHYREDGMKKVYEGDDLYCHSCVPDITPATDEEVGAQCRLADDLTDELELAHRMVLDAVAEKHNKTTRYVQWILFDAADEDIERKQELISERILMEEDYEQLYTMVTDKPTPREVA